MAETKLKSNSVITHEVDEARGRITWRVVGEEPLTLDLAALSDGVKARAMIHGLVQRVGDRAAISRDPETGRPATPADKRARMAGLVEHLMAGGDWEMGRAKGGTSTSRNDPVIAAVAEIQGTDYATMAERVKAMAEKRGVKPRAIIARLATQPDVVERLRAMAPKDEGDWLEELKG